MYAGIDWWEERVYIKKGGTKMYPKRAVILLGKKLGWNLIFRFLLDTVGFINGSFDVPYLMTLAYLSLSKHVAYGNVCWCTPFDDPYLSISK